MVIQKIFLKLKLHRDTTSSTSDFYEFRMSLFKNDKPEEFLLFINNFNMPIVVSGTLDTGMRIKSPCTLFYGEALRHFDLSSADVEITKTLNVEYIIKGYNYPCKFAFQTKSRDAPQNEETSRSKSNMLCGALD